MSLPSASYRPARSADRIMIRSSHAPPTRDATKYPSELGMYSSPMMMAEKLYGDSEKTDWMLMLRTYSEPKVMAA